MREDVIYEAVTNIDEELIDAAQKRKRLPAKWMATAAAVAVVIGVGAVALPRLLGGRQGVTADGGGSGEGSTFMSYAGPVLPLTLGEENDSITAQRETTLDFAPWVPVWITNEEEAASRDWLTEEERQEILEQYNEWFPEGGREEWSTDILVTDQYVLTNDSTDDQTVTVRYPYVTKLRDAETVVLTVDGVETAAETIFGSDSGGFAGSSPDDTGTWNIKEPDNWEGYRELLESGAYEAAALAPAPDLSQTMVTVYRLSNPTCTWEGEEPENPEVLATFDQNYDTTRLLTYGFNMGNWDPETGRTSMGYSLHRPEADAEPRYLVAVGEDIGEISFDERWDDEVFEATAEVVRYETDLESVLWEILEVQLKAVVDSGWFEEGSVSLEDYYTAVARAFVDYGPLAERAADRYDVGWLDDFLTDVLARQRVAYLQTEVTVPAGETVTVAFDMVREGSYDYYGAGGQHGVYGYDMTTTLASNLTFTGQTATLMDHGQIEIVRQNFGFDLDAGITTVALDLKEPHYYLEVRRISES